MRRATRAGDGYLDQLLYFAGVGGQHQNAISEKNRFLEIVRNEDNRDVNLAPNLEQMRLHATARLRVKRAERLVHQQNTRLVGERAHDCYALLHAAG